MTQTVVYQGVLVTPIDRTGSRIRVECVNLTDAQRAEIPFSEMRDGKAIFAKWVEETELVALDHVKESKDS